MSGEESVQFVDTNVLIYAYDRSAGEKHARAQALVADLWRVRRGCLSVQVLQEFYVVGARKLIEIEPADLHVILADLALWQVHAPVASDVLGAVDLHERYQVSFWDAMILQKRGTAWLCGSLVGGPQCRAGIPGGARVQPVYHRSTSAPMISLTPP